MTAHAMLDLETLGSHPGCVVLSIGACIFDPESGVVWGAPDKTFGLRISIKSCVAVGLRLEADTLEWWLAQDVRARNEAMVAGHGWGIADALAKFHAWYRAANCQFVWCHGATFDVPVLDAAFAACKLEVPWAYKQVRDTRTVFHLGKMGPHLDAVAERVGAGVKHSALADAITQAAQVCEAYKMLEQGPGYLAPVAAGGDPLG